jgi:hypothetical protein
MTYVGQQELVLRLLAAAVLGGLIGLDRELFLRRGRGGNGHRPVRSVGLGLVERWTRRRFGDD